MDNLTIFDLMYEQYKITKPIRLIEFFAGYGSQAFALKYLGVPFEHWRICEWAVPSIQAYKDAHFTNNNIDYSKCFTKEYIIEVLYNNGISMDYNQPMKLEQIKRMSEEQLRTIYNNILATNNLVNIQKVKGERLDIVEQDKYTYVLTYSFPCQDLSLAGKGKGMSRDGGTRSGMLWEVERILDECNELNCLPQVLLMENVPQVIGEKNIKDFQSWREKLENLGYSNYIEVLNAKHYGIPQNRERAFMISIFGEYNYTFPKKIPLELKLKDMLEKSVDEKYYLSDKMIKFFYENEKKQKEKGNGFKFGVSDGNCIAKTITTRAGSRMDDNYIDMQKSLKETLENNNIEDIDNVAYIDAYNRNIRKDEISCAITTRVNDSNNSYLLIKEATKKGMCQTLKTSIDVGVVVKDENKSRIRKLTPKECFRLMGVKDEDYENIAKNQSNSKLYHLAGDSIVVNVLMGIFKEMM